MLCYVIQAGTKKGGVQSVCLETYLQGAAALLDLHAVDHQGMGARTVGEEILQNKSTIYSTNGGQLC